MDYRNVHRGIAHSPPGPIRAGALYYARLGRASSVLYPCRRVLGLLGLSIYSTMLGAITTGARFRTQSPVF